MNFFKIKTSWSNAEFIILKICIATAYILIGAYYHNFFRTWYVPVLIVFAVTVVWSLYLWVKKMKTEK
jgi:hypothetical protein